MTIKRKPIRDQVIVVARAATPTGLAAAHAAARAGARVMLIDRAEIDGAEIDGAEIDGAEIDRVEMDRGEINRGAAALGEAVRAINNAGGVADYVVADPHDADALGAAGHQAKARFGRVDSWVLAAADDAGHLDHGCRAAVSALRHEGGALIVVGSTPTVVRQVETLRASLAQQAPLVAVALVRLAGPDADPQRAADAIVRSATRPQDEVSVGAAPAPLRLAKDHPGLVAALGLGGLAIAAGAVAAWRRPRSPDA